MKHQDTLKDEIAIRKVLIYLYATINDWLDSPELAKKANSDAFEEEIVKRFQDFLSQRDKERREAIEGLRNKYHPGWADDLSESGERFHKGYEVALTEVLEVLK